MKVYVASSNKNRPAVRTAIAKLVTAGHVVPYDWTVHKLAEELMSEDEAHAKLRGFAEQDLAGVVAADATIVLAHPLMRATHSELGMAIALGKVVVVVDAETGPFNIFYHLPQVNHVATVDQAVDFLAGRGGVDPAPGPVETVAR